MELRHIRYFIVAAEEQHFGRAAQRLHVSQSALSQQIRNLEEGLGVALFDRLARGVILSDAGKTFLEGVRPMMNDLNETCLRTRRAGLGQVGRVKLAINEFATAHEIVAMAIDRFRKASPEIELEILPMTSQMQLESLRDGRIDAGFLYHRPAADTIFSHLHIKVDRFNLALPRNHPLAKRRKLLLRDLKDEKFVCFRRANVPHFYEQLLKACAKGGLTPDVIQEVDNQPTVLDLVSVGMGLAFVTVPNPSNLPKGVVLHEVDDFKMDNSLELVWLTANKSPSLKRVVETVSALMDKKVER